LRNIKLKNINSAFSPSEFVIFAKKY